MTCLSYYLGIIYMSGIGWISFIIVSVLTILVYFQLRIFQKGEVNK
jgi:hypothetical protein